MVNVSEIMLWPAVVIVHSNCLFFFLQGHSFRFVFVFRQGGIFFLIFPFLQIEQSNNKKGNNRTDKTVYVEGFRQT